MAFKYWTGSHTKHRLLYHIVWIPKARQPVLEGKIVARLKHYFYEACKMNWWWLDEVQILTDHVHILIQLPPKQSVSEAVQILKGGTSRLMRQEFPELQEFIWGDSLWADGYFAETIGVRNASQVKKYIKENIDSMPNKTNKRGRGL